MPVELLGPSAEDADKAGTSAEIVVQQAFEAALQGAAVPQPLSGGKRLLLVLEEQLPLDAKLRFRALFGVQPRWCAHEIAPYLRRAYDADCRTEAELLLRYTRSVREQPDGPVVHCAR
jgi:hypothetical protein